MRLGLGLSIAQPRGRGFSPADIPNLAIWLDASDASTITKDGSDLVSQWSDKSGKGNHAVQATALRKPKYIASAINGKPAIQGRHDGTNGSQLSIADNLTLDYAQFTVFSVVRRITDLGPLGETISGKWNVTSNGREHYCSISGSTDRPLTVASQLGTATNANVGASAASDTINQFIHSSKYDGTNVITKINGGSALTGSLSAVFNGAASYALFTRDGSAFTEPLAGYIAEHLFYVGSLSVDDEARNISYLKAKWGIA